MFPEILMIFVVLKFTQYFAEKYLSRLNRTYYLSKPNQDMAMKALDISQEDMDKSLTYSTDKYTFGVVTGWINITLLMVVLATGVLGRIEAYAQAVAAGNSLLEGLIFFGFIGLAMIIFGLPFSAYNTFVIEQKHGFNRQTPKGFVLDFVKSLVLGVILGGLILSVILLIMEKAGAIWWLYAWFALSGFSILTAWLYPTLLAPLFNKFSPLEDGDLKEQIFKLAKGCDFNASGLSVMNASIRSSHGNAYFTGMFGKKKIVLFDTLIEAMKASEVVAVLAHELGHFKLNHVRWMILRSILMTGVTFYLLSLCLPLEEFYKAFGLAGLSNYGALIVFSLWFSLIDFLMQPMETFLSRKNEFAADKFALEHIDGKKDLGAALLKLRQKSHSMPISHPLFSGFYYSHPPMIERLKAMNYN